jgi:hypothetical protein
MIRRTSHDAAPDRELYHKSKEAISFEITSYIKS